MVRCWKNMQILVHPRDLEYEVVIEKVLKQESVEFLFDKIVKCINL